MHNVFWDSSFRKIVHCELDAGWSSFELMLQFWKMIVAGLCEGHSSSSGTRWKASFDAADEVHSRLVYDGCLLHHACQDSPRNCWLEQDLPVHLNSGFADSRHCFAISRKQRPVCCSVHTSIKKFSWCHQILWFIDRLNHCSIIWTHFYQRRSIFTYSFYTWAFMWCILFCRRFWAIPVGKPKK